MNGYSYALVRVRYLSNRGPRKSMLYTHTTPTVLYMLSLNDRKDVGKRLHSSRIICFSKLLGLWGVGRTNKPYQVTYGCNRCLDG
jgi:hypothetical protein